ncbi:DgyrCDS3453 [Dimorphilus gyrociliatus]|uniref:DgyrCDS3453 n=1 Tax=Dimorphilus gyrociliatus TaxID=2664684 RepID=A0A7I8VDT5_9ANNE|nr:DgyrCDS3453 [Dimorphilus gyrociliatus]
MNYTTAEVEMAKNFVGLGLGFGFVLILPFGISTIFGLSLVMFAKNSCWVRKFCVFVFHVVLGFVINVLSLAAALCLSYAIRGLKTINKERIRFENFTNATSPDKLNEIIAFLISSCVLYFIAYICYVISTLLVCFVCREVEKLLGSLSIKFPMRPTIIEVTGKGPIAPEDLVNDSESAKPIQPSEAVSTTRGNK